jgi:ribosomal protein L30E
MAKLKEVSEDLKSLKDKVQKNQVVVGTDRVMKELKAGHLASVFIAKNTRHDTREDLAHYAKLSGISIVELEMDNEEFGVFCKKNFFVSVLGTLEE